MTLPPSSTLFPYTTLFRSLHQVLGAHPDGVGDGGRRPVGPAGLLLQQPVQELSRPGPVLGTFRQTDRKSTRLNSSHSSISYAVFCLIKKSTPHGLACTNTK